MLMRLRFAVIAGVLLASFAPAQAGDWPMYRFDANRSAATPEQLPGQLHLQWVREFPALQPAWPDQPKLQIDAVYEPVVLGKRLFLGSSSSDTLTAFDTERPTQPESGAAAGRPSGASAEAVTVPPAEETGKESPDIPAVDTDTRLLVNIAGGLAVGLLVIVACGIFYVARSRA